MIDQSTTEDPILQTAARYAPEAAARAEQARADPWTVAVVGRVGAGKTTLLNQWTGEDRPVGLGGVTTAITECSTADRVWLDTPGIDGLDRAITELGPAIAAADAVLWVVDGLQPATRTERDLFAAVCHAGQPLAAVVGRLDIVEADQHHGILDRVRTVLGDEEPPPGGDLRVWAEDAPAAVAPAPTSPRRQLARQAAIRAALIALEALPPLEGRGALGRRLADRWRGQVKEVVGSVVAGLGDGTLDVNRQIQDRFRREAVGAVSRFQASLDDEPLLQDALADGRPDLPLPEPPDPSAMEMVVAAMGGELRARVRLEEQGAHWLGEGLLVLADWLDQARGIDAARLQREADHDQLLRAGTPAAP